MARPKGFEPLTPRFVVWCSIQLSYGRLRRLCWPPVSRVSKSFVRDLQGHANAELQIWFATCHGAGRSASYAERLRRSASGASLRIRR